MAETQNDDLYLDHTGQEIDDNIDEVISARGAYETLSDALAALRTAINAIGKAIIYRGEVDYYESLPQSPSEGDAYKVLYKGSSGQQPLDLVYFWGDDGEGNKSWVSFDSSDYYAKSQVDAMIANVSSSLQQQISEVKSQVSNMSFVEISKTDYEEIPTKSRTTVYFVYDDEGHIMQYLGEAQLSSGVGAAGNAVARANGVSVLAAGYAQRQTANLTEYGLAECSFNDNTGAITEDTGTGKLGTQNMISIPTDATGVIVNAVTQSQQNLEWCCYLYDANGDYLSSESRTSYSGQTPYGWKTSTKMQQIPPTAKYMRFGLRISSNLPALTPSDIESAIAIF